ncbi:hypothetical protein K503DRAFT_516440 [Rhizopogon vinicolor AM-OR11-026]|uniref:Uncharacterized protein n=1 Tax=Rhizopogon vinicolor AM-OR11-026 TaxID=1314800 RepID=A0A1B7N8X2_9AGAM|nr:hypothetical protein K503DRAFT_516440 [Rhizopogon vinicolor AM-OR11-026]
MTELEKAVDALKAAVKQRGNDKRVSDVVNQFTSYLVLLKSSSPSSQSISKLRSILRRPLVPLYNEFPEHTLQLSSAVLRKVIDDKLRNALNAQNAQLSASWNEVAVTLLSGVLDFLDKNCDDLSKETAASAFYPTICTLFFYQDTALTLSPRTQTTAYSLLHDTLFKHPGNQGRLRDHAVLGGSLIGFAISQSKDYLVIEALLNIVGWLIPPTHKTEQGKAKRTEFIQELFGSDRHFSCSQELVDILQYISSSHWEDTAMKIMDALARSDIRFPQPFALDEVDVCGKTYPQLTAFDRLHLDRDCFLVNVVEKDDVCESLKIPYGHIRSVTIDTLNVPAPNKATVHVDLAASPIMGEVSLDVMAGQNLYLKFEVQREDLSRLMEALRRRGVVKLSFLGENIPKQISKRKSIALAHSIRLPGDSSPPPQESQYEDKVKHVANVHETNFPDDTRPITARFEPEILSVQQVPSRMPAKSKPEVQKSVKQASAVCASKTVPRPRPVPKSAKNVEPLQVTSPRKNPVVDTPPRAAHASVFGESNEELSELSGEPAPKPTAKCRLRVLSAKNATARLSPGLSPSDSIPPLPATRRTAKRRLVVDSDEEIQATPTAVQRTVAISSSKQHTKAEIMSTELVKVHHIRNTRSSTMQSSSIIEDADHPEITSPLVLQKPSTPSRDETHPEPIENVAEARLHEDVFLMGAPACEQAPPCEAIPTAELLPEATVKPTPPVKKITSAGRGASRHVSPGPSNAPAKLAGTRRKREDANSPTGVPVALDDDHPPKKKARNTIGGNTETKRDSKAVMLSDPFDPSASTTTPARNAKKYGKKGKVSPPIPPENVDFDEVPGAGPKGRTNTRAKAVRGASKPIPKKLPARQTRANATRRRDEKPAAIESPKGISSKVESSEPEVGIVAGPNPADQTIAMVSPKNEVINASSKPELTSSKQVDKRDVDQASMSTIAPKDLIKNDTTDAAVRQPI